MRLRLKRKSRRKPAVIQLLDRELPAIQAEIVHLVETRIAAGAIVTSVVDGVVVQHKRKRILAEA